MLVLAAAVAVLLGGDCSGAGEGDRGGGSVGREASAEVLRVVDGDTIEVEVEGGTEDVRYIGIDTPVLWSLEVVPRFIKRFDVVPAVTGARTSSGRRIQENA